MESMWKDGIIDEFSAIQTRDLLDLLALNIHDPPGPNRSSVAFERILQAPATVSPEACLVVSGSNRTALASLASL